MDDGRRLVITADDYGMSEGVNDGIEEAIAAGSVSAVSVLTNELRADDAVLRVRSFAGTVGVGLHFNVTHGRPLTAARTLIDPRTGEFRSLPDVVARAVDRRLSITALHEECSAQLARLSAAGVRATHIDSHRHVHLLPGISNAVLDVASEAGGLHVRLPLEWRAFAWASARVAHRNAALRLAWLTLPGHVRRRFRVAAGETTHFFGISLQGGVRFAEKLGAALDRLPTGVAELMVHPGRVDDSRRQRDRYTWPREAERRVLTSPLVQRWLGERDIILTHFGRERATSV